MYFSKESKRKINATIFQAYIVCPREAWFLFNSIPSNPEHSYLEIGRLIHETSYSRNRKEIFIDRLLKIDLIKGKLIGEIKKSSRHRESARLQLLFYLYYLKKEKGLEDLDGVLLFPKERKREEVKLTPEDEKRIEELLKEMEEVLNKPTPPPLEKKPYCRTCSYREICWA